MEQALLLNAQVKREQAFMIFMNQMNAAEESVQEHGYFAEEDVELELAKI